MGEITIIHFANDTPLTETKRGFSVTAEALELGDVWPNQILGNGYSYSIAYTHEGAGVYTRDHDGVTLRVTREGAPS